MKTPPHGALLPVLLLCGAALAQPAAPRDPTRPPAGAAALPAPPASGAPGAPAASAPGAARHIMVVDGQRYVIDAGRRRGVGELLGGARIERIEDSAVFVRDGGQLLRLPMYGSVVKRPSADGSPLASPLPVAAPLRPQRPALDLPTRPLRPGEPR